MPNLIKVLLKIKMTEWPLMIVRAGQQWLDSDLIPRLLKNFENWKNFMVILLSVKNGAYRRFFGALACSRAQISFCEILKLESGQTTLKNHFFQKIFQRSIPRSEVHTLLQFSRKNIHVFQSYRWNSIFRTSAILEVMIFHSVTYGHISNQNFIANSAK